MSGTLAASIYSLSTLCNAATPLECCKQLLALHVHATATYIYRITVSTGMRGCLDSPIGATGRICEHVILCTLIYFSMNHS